MILKVLESFYRDRGYLKFSIESSQISLSRDMKKIYINFNIFEGKKYSISEAEVVGDIPIEEELYESIVSSLRDLTYSQAQIYFH